MVLIGSYHPTLVKELAWI